MAYAKKNQQTESRVVKWLMQEKKIIKFQGDETTYNLKGKVADFDHAKVGVKTGVTVDVAISGDEVTFMRKSEVQKEATKEETKVPEANKPTVTTLNGEQCVWTISGVPTSKEVIAFKEGKVKWYQVSDEIKQKDWAKEGYVAKAQVKVTIGSVDVKGEKKPCVMTMEILKGETQKSETVVEVETKQPEAPKSQSENINLKDDPSDSWQVKQLKNKINYLLEVKQGSIERQSCWSSACQIISSMISAGTITIDELAAVNEAIEKLANDGLKFVRSNE